MHILVSILLSWCAARAESAKIVPFQHKARNSCESQLQSGAGRTIPFPNVQPPYESSGRFFEKDGAQIYFFYSEPASDPFQNPFLKSWLSRPALPAGEWLYVLKAEARARSDFEPRLSLREIHARYRALGFTKIRVPKVFRIVCHLIADVRGIESHELQQVFEPIEFDYRFLLNPRLNAYSLENIVNSWLTKTAHEARIKELIKEWLARTGLSDDEHRDCRNLSLYLAPKIRELFEHARFAQSVLDPVLNSCL
jgi:hypothetical protein